MARKLSDYNIFVKEYLEDHPGSTFSQAAKAWKGKGSGVTAISMPGGSTLLHGVLGVGIGAGVSWSLGQWFNIPIPGVPTEWYPFNYSAILAPIGLSIVGLIGAVISRDYKALFGGLLVGSAVIAAYNFTKMPESPPLALVTRRPVARRPVKATQRSVRPLTPTFIGREQTPTFINQMTPTGIPSVGPSKIVF